MDNLSHWAWEPVTPRGVAAFARAKISRLLAALGIVAALIGASLGWLLQAGIFPTVTGAIERLPEAGEIRSARLDWPGSPIQPLAEGRFLAISVDLEHTGEFRSPAHVQVEFGRNKVRAISLFGYADMPYPTGWVVAFNRTELLPKWGAWRPALLALAVACVIACVGLTWLVLATLYSGPVWLTGFFANRDLSWTGSWKLAGAALLPGGLVMALAFVAYGLGMLDLVRLAFAWGFHLVLGWIYAGISLLFLPRHPQATAPGRNPFVSDPGS